MLLLKTCDFCFCAFDWELIEDLLKDCWLKHKPLKTIGCSRTPLQAESVVVDWITILLLYTYGL